MAVGRLRVQVLEEDTFIPIPNTRVTIIPRGENIPQIVRQQQVTNSVGQTEAVELPAPPIEFSQSPSSEIPYSFADVQVEADGYLPLIVRGVQIFPELTAIQVCNLISTRKGEMRGIKSQEINIKPHRMVEDFKEMQRQQEVIYIQENTLVGNFPPKIPEDEEKPLPPEKGVVVLENVVVPEFVVVHDGRPEDNNAPNYTVRYKDYIKNVACCEIFSTWPENSIRANIYCIISFTLNRIYTEWYRNKGKDFTITTSTAFDQAFSFGRNIYENINRIVDDIFSTYIKRPEAKQPLFAQYCDGVRVQCPGWLTQWGSKYLADQGRTPYEILTNFYGTNLELRRAPEVEGIPISYPGTVLSIGSRGNDVRNIQTYLNRISQNYPLIPKVAVDGVYGPATANSVKVFQQVFGLPETGNVDYATWYEISQIFVGVSKLAELRAVNMDELNFTLTRSSDWENLNSQEETEETPIEENNQKADSKKEDVESEGPYVAASRKVKSTRRIFFPPLTYEMYYRNDIPKVGYMDDGL
ncbi:peptidoglycan-binding domain-containing protein [Clostridium polynesiense]|uniref:peptidoglycan-binding domain-containing protein n=1 Tax=Clostridium polynesiense TaxID=1325933 RepID=UPI0009E4D5BB|nr:peptidoglycan-binding domain-containing protein [Clostridium polynesiense]